MSSGGTPVVLRGTGAPRLAGVAFAWLAAIAAPAAAEEVGGSIVRSGVVREDLYLAGGQVDVMATVEGDLVVVGGRLSLGNHVAGDVMAAGGDVSVQGQVLDDVRAAGGMVAIRAEVGGDLTAAGGAVRVAPDARIAGKAWLAGGDVDVRGRVGGRLRAAGRTIRIGGEIDGDVELAGGEIEILPTARVRGALVYRSPRDAEVAPGAQIDGGVQRQPAEWPDPRPALRKAGLAIAVVAAAGAAVAGIVLAVLLPGVTAASARTIRSAPWKSLGVGFAVLVSAPIAAVVLMVTLVGLPLGVAFLALYVLVLLLGLLVGATWVGSIGALLLRGDSSRSRVVVSLLAGLAVLALVALVPVLGAVVQALVLIVGIGGWSIHGYRRYSIPPGHELPPSGPPEPAVG